MWGACCVVYQGHIHFFGGQNYSEPYNVDLRRQHFTIETKRSGKTVKITKQKDLAFEFDFPSCSSFEIASDSLSWFSTNVVVICFNSMSKGCYLFDGELKYINDAEFSHNGGGLTKYKKNLITVGHFEGFYGGLSNQKTEMMERNKNGSFTWFEVKPEFKFSSGPWFAFHSLVTIPLSSFNEEYVLLIGGTSFIGIDLPSSKDVFKFNETWFHFGQLNEPRSNHNSIFWNNAVYVIGGGHMASLLYGDEQVKPKMEIWNITDSPDEFKTSENWPQLYQWEYPHLGIVPDSFFPDY